MDTAKRFVNTLPLAELWNESGPLNLKRGPQLGRAEIVSRLRLGNIQFVLADVGQPLRWVASDAAYRLWKEEVRSRVVPPAIERFSLDDYPGFYCYLAWEWRNDNGETVVVLERQH